MEGVNPTDFSTIFNIIFQLSPIFLQLAISFWISTDFSSLSWQKKRQTPRGRKGLRRKKTPYEWKLNQVRRGRVHFLFWITFKSTIALTFELVLKKRQASRGRKRLRRRETPCEWRLKQVRQRNGALRRWQSALRKHSEALTFRACLSMLTRDREERFEVSGEYPGESKTREEAKEVRKCSLFMSSIAKADANTRRG